MRDCSDHSRDSRVDMTLNLKTEKSRMVVTYWKEILLGIYFGKVKLGPERSAELRP